MADPSDSSGRIFGASGMIELTGKIMVVAIILLFFVVVFFFCLHLYAKWFWYRHQENTTVATSRRRRRRRLDFAGGHQEITIVRRGLDPWVLKSIPIVIISVDSKEWKDGLIECAVCLCEVSGGEKARVLPKCNHGFHVECIDMWFQSHSTCPLCRNHVSDLEKIVEPWSEVPNFPSNVTTLDEASTSNRPNGILVIDIPRQINQEEEEKSDHEVPSSRLRSLKRLLSGNTRVNPSSPRNLNPEQGDQI